MFRRTIFTLSLLCATLFTSVVFAQDTQPVPGAPKSTQTPLVRDKKLPNGLTVVTGEKHGIPLVTIQLLVKSAASDEGLAHAGLADMTASLLTKGTKTRNATQIAEAIEFLGGSISSGAGWNVSTVTVTVTSDKVDQALAILADVVLNPTFKQDELDLLKSQSLDGLTYNLKQPGFLSNYVASRYSFGEHPAGGTPESLKAMSRTDIVDFHKTYYRPENAVLIFAGDILQSKANAAATKFFGRWKPSPPASTVGLTGGLGNTPKETTSPKRILVIDLPNSGQAAVKYSRKIAVGRVTCSMPTSCLSSEVFYPATVMNSVLGGGYSSRLNQEIRIKRGLSYGAGSGFSWRDGYSNFATSTQTKPESAAEVAELVIEEIEKLGDKNVSSSELDPRKLVLTGDFGQELETTAGLAGRIADLYIFDLRPAELNSYTRDVRLVTDAQIKSFADSSLRGGDIIIVGDAKMFMDDLKKRFPKMMINMIAADDLDVSKESLRK